MSSSLPPDNLFRDKETPHSQLASTVDCASTYSMIWTLEDEQSLKIVGSSHNFPKELSVTLECSDYQHSLFTAIQTETPQMTLVDCPKSGPLRLLLMPFSSHHGQMLFGLALPSRDHFLAAFELWKPSTERAELVLSHGQYEGMAHFEQISQQSQFLYGEGLPGQVWKAKSPQFMNPLDSLHGFVRAKEAFSARLSLGIGFPFYTSQGSIRQVMLLLAQEGLKSQCQFFSFQKSSPTPFMALDENSKLLDDNNNLRDHIERSLSENLPIIEYLELAETSSSGHLLQSISVLPVSQGPWSQSALIIIH